VRLKRIDHVGVIVDDLREAAELLSSGFGLELDAKLDRPELSAEFYACGDVSIELIEVSDPEVRRTRLGEGQRARIEHIAIEVEDLDATLEALEALGVRPNAPARRTNGSVSVWTDPGTSDGVMFQFMQKDAVG